MHISHIFACGMGGIRTSGDLVAWMQLTKKMKLTEAKKYVAEKLGIEIPTLCFVQGFEPVSSCYLCAVQIEGRPNLSPACAMLSVPALLCFDGPPNSPSYL